MTKVITAANIAAVIKAARKTRRMSQAKLAERAGLQQPQISQIEAGKDTAHIGIVLRVIASLDLTIDISDGFTEASVAPSPAPQSTVIFDEPLPDDSIDLDAIVSTRRGQTK